MGKGQILYNCLNPISDCGGHIDIDYCCESNVKLIVDPIMFRFNINHRDAPLFSNDSRINEYVYFHLNNMNKISLGMISEDMYMKWDASANTRINTGLLALS